MSTNPQRLFARHRFAWLGVAICIALASASPAMARAPLKVALLPIIDSLPFYVADQRHYFEDAGVKVEAVKVASGMARDQLMQTGQIDGMLNEIISSANFNRERARVKIVAVVRTSRPGHPLFRLLAAPGSTFQGVATLADATIGISRHTVIEYVTDRLLEQAGLLANQARKQSVPAIPERYQLLIQGRLAAATLPDPLAMSAMAAGAVLMADDTTVADCSLSILTFATAAVKAKHDQIQAFLDAWHRAVSVINSEPHNQRDLMLANIRIPPNVRTLYRIPPFVRHRVPTQTQWQDAMDWMQARQLLAAPLPYHGSVTDQFIQRPPTKQP